MKVTTPDKELVLWRDAIAVHLSTDDAKDFLSMLRIPQIQESTSFYAKIILWQLEDQIFGLRHISAVRKDHRISAFYDELTALYRREASGEIISDSSFEAVHDKIESTWAVIGIKRKMYLGIIKYRLAWIGGERFAEFLVRGWSEAWIWALAASRKRGSGQTSVLVWSWARAGGKKRSSAYNERIQALRSFYIDTLHI